MKKFNVGDVWLYEPYPNQEKTNTREKSALSEVCALSRRPVVIFRGTDDDSPYDTVIVVPGTSQPVPVISFEKDEVSYTGKKRMECLRVKPYELYTVNAHHLVCYYGRLEENEITMLQNAVEAYLSGTPIKNICPNIDEWHNRKLHIVADKVRKSLAPMIEEPAPVAVEPEIESTETTKTCEEYFDVPKDDSIRMRICKSYCGPIDRVNQNTVDMIRSVPLKDAEKINSMTAKAVVTKYRVAKAAAGALKLLAKDYIENNKNFSWLLPEEPEVSEEEVDKNEQDKKEETEPDIDYGPAISRVKAYLTDKSIRYATGNVLKDILSIPKEILEKEYSGTKFVMNYHELCNRAQ